MLQKKLPLLVTLYSLIGYAKGGGGKRIVFYDDDDGEYYYV